MNPNFIHFVFRSLVQASFVCYLASLFLPGLIYRPPDSLANHSINYQVALGLVQQGGRCWARSDLFKLTKDGLEEIGSGDRSGIRPETQNWYCVGKDATPGYEQSGASILLQGWMELAGGGEAWFANVIGAFSGMTAIGVFLLNGPGGWVRGGKMVILTLGSIVACCAFWVGLYANNFHFMPRDESGSNYLEVDRLGPGFYVWEASFLLLALALFCGCWEQWAQLDPRSAHRRQ